jgi:peptidoglycan L-alanyl-D-glutamate endopeptidase CwlK
MDQITLKRIERLNIRVREEALEIYKDICEALTGRAVCRFTHTLRTFEEQNALFEQGRKRPGKKVTNARGGQSFHNYGLAIDICLIIDGKEASWDTLSDFDGDHVSDWQEIVRIFKMYGWEWGGDWKFRDMPHFQKTLGMTIKDLQRLMPNGLK